MLLFPSEKPESAKAEVWRIQELLLDQAEELLGPRDAAKKVYQPAFGDGCPHIVNTPTLDGAFAVLSKNAAGYWPTLVYELSHETVHLLNPVVGHANWLEEGVAVAFSVEMSQTLTAHPMEPSGGTNYARALSMVKELPVPCLEAGARVRGLNGSLSSATVESLRTLFPEADETLLKQLAAPC